VRLAARRLAAAQARSDEDEDDRTVDACIGLEALLGEGRDELTHRLALRAATVLATRSDEAVDARVVYGLVKKVYSHRSAVVHGSASDKHKVIKVNGTEWSASAVAVFLLREVLRDALTGEWTPSSLDDRLLQSLRSPGVEGTEPATDSSGKTE
jgi:hypothetical protein